MALFRYRARRLTRERDDMIVHTLEAHPDGLELYALAASLNISKDALFHALDRLCQQGTVEAFWRPDIDEVEAGRLPQPYYRLPKP
jgi:predicted ArsR family transcriptional regulator